MQGENCKEWWVLCEGERRGRGQKPAESSSEAYEVIDKSLVDPTDSGD